MYARSLFIILPALMLLVSCTHKDSYVPAMSIHDLSYGPDTAQKVDVYLPDDRSAAYTAVIIMIHGGGWNSGDKADFDYTQLYSLCMHYGYAVVNMNYRLAEHGRNLYPAQLDDMDLVLQMIAQKAAGWHINSRQVCLLGRSAGGHMALQYAYTRNSEQRIKGVLDFFGPADFPDTALSSASLNKDIANLLGCSIAANRSLWYDASPLAHTANAVPTFIVQGTADETVWPRQSVSLAQKLLAANIPCVLDTLPGRTHFLDTYDWEKSASRALVWISSYIAR